MKIDFTQKWVEQAVQKLLGKEEIEVSDLTRIKYLSIGESFDNDFFIEMSLEAPPKPFVNADGGDEWALCLRGGDIAKLVEKYKGETDVELSMYGLEREDKEWERIVFSGKVEKLWRKFTESVTEERYYVKYDNDDDFEEWYDGVSGSLWQDLVMFTGVEVLRVQGLKIPNLMFLENFTKLRTAEFVETAFAKTNGIERLNGLEQLACWLD